MPQIRLLIVQDGDLQRGPILGQNAVAPHLPACLFQ